MPSRLSEGRPVCADPAEWLVCVFQCYLDESGLPIITLGGFFARSNRWERGEPLRHSAMNNHGIDIFHAKQFHDTDPPFKGWSKVRKRSFTDEVFSASHGALAVAIGVEKEGLKEGKKRQPKAFNRTPLMGVAFACIMTRILTHLSVAAHVKQHGSLFPG